jgi:hypothetical protein
MAERHQRYVSGRNFTETGMIDGEWVPTAIAQHEGFVTLQYMQNRRRWPVPGGATGIPSVTEGRRAE